ncbi:hypothetical protein BELL_0279g00060 [Botrytis elliptica]|uniref:Uncharacterized protein n=1 Tax=Botrytis elliptica TaxID=278938 RepID=A0A4Z1JZG5_9HELO|nr:hypothetical protein BELL_0279g00060 [Botrytis elliptica]
MIFTKDRVTPFMRIGPSQIPGFLTFTKYRSSKIEKRSRFVTDLMPGQDKHNVVDHLPWRYSDRAG